MDTNDARFRVQFIPAEWVVRAVDHFARTGRSSRVVSHAVDIDRREHERRQIQIGLDEMSRRKVQRRRPAALVALFIEHLGEFFSPELRSAYVLDSTHNMKAAA